MDKIRKSIHFLLVISLVAGLVITPFGDLHTVAAEDAMSGTHGSISWSLTEDHPANWDLKNGTPYKLTLTGTGEMKGGTAPWKKYSPTITSVSIGSGITSIGSYAFSQCVSLETITIPDSVTELNSDAFADCTKLTTVNLGRGVKTIGLRAFYRCISLTSIAIPDSVTSIETQAFSGCKALAEVTGAQGVTEIGSGSFRETAITEITFRRLEILGELAFYNSALEQITLPNTLTSIGRLSFSGSKLAEITIPENVSEIGSGFLYSVSTLQNIEVSKNNPYFYMQDHILYERKDNLPYRTIAYLISAEADTISIENGTELIDDRTFGGAVHLVSVLLPDTLKSIGESAFSGCKGLEEIVIPNAVETIGSSAFSNNTSLRTVSIGKSLNRCYGMMFSGCINLEQITVSDENPYIEAVDNVVYDEEYKTLYLYAPKKQDESYHIADTVEEIFSEAVFSAHTLKDLYMPANLTKIYSMAIENNRQLKAVYFQGNAPENTGNAIVYCSADLVLYKREESTGWTQAVWSSYLIMDWTPEDERHETGYFGDVFWEYTGDIGALTFTGSGEIPDFTEEEPAPWNAYMGSIQTIDADGITGIGNYAFFHAQKLMRMKMNGALNTIGDYTFADCVKLTLADIAGASEIGKGAFLGDVSMEHLTLEKAENIGEEAFKGCAGITDVTLGNVLTALEREAFADCQAVQDFIVPSSVTVIGDGALKGCIMLDSVNIPASVTSIGAQAFSGDSMLSKVYFYGNIPKTWDKSCFEECSEDLTLYYRVGKTDWSELGETWNEVPVLGLEQFYTEKRDTYSFANNAFSFGYDSGYRIPRQRYVDVLKSIVQGTYYYTISKAWNGSCYGMAASALEFYENESFDVTDYNEDAEYLYDLAAPGVKDAALTRLIEGYQLSQFKISLAGSDGSISRNRGAYREMVHKVEAFERAGGTEIDANAGPILILAGSVYNAHALVPVSVEQADNGDFLMQVYDPNRPERLQTLTVAKDFSRISYQACAQASYLDYAEVAAAMSGVTLYEDRKDTSVYLSVNRASGTVITEDGKNLEEIEGAYEQKPYNSDGQDEFSGMKSFVLPAGNYEIFAQDETDDAKRAEFYLAGGDTFAQVICSDKNAKLAVKQETDRGGLELILQSDSKEAETAAVTVMNQIGMERTIEVDGANLSLRVLEDDTVEIAAPDGASVLVDKNVLEMQEQKGVVSFEAAEDENPWKKLEARTSTSCNEKNNLCLTAEVTLVSNAADAKDVAVGVRYIKEDGAQVASYTETKRVNAGLNMFTISFEDLPTNYGTDEGEVSLKCILTVRDEDGSVEYLAAENVKILLEKQPEEPTETPTEEPTETPTEEPTEMPTEEPTETPTETPTEEPTETPTEEPTETPSEEPTETPTETPTEMPTEEPTETPTETPTEEPTEEPTETSTETPTEIPTEIPSEKLSENHTVSGETAVTKIIAPAEITVGQGETFEIAPSVVPQNAANASLTYSARFGYVNIEKNSMTARCVGTEEITVSAANGVKMVVRVTIKKAPKKITLNAKKKTLKAGKSFQIKVKLPKGTASNKITYSSNKKSVASVTSAGKVIAKKKGSAIITARTFNGKKATMKITVNGKISVKKIVVTTKKLTLNVGDTVWLNVSVKPGNAANKKLTFRASNNRIKVDSKGKIIAKRAGTSKVTIKASGGKKVVVRVTVK